ncbi:MAG: ABC transporter ATP-binding protein [Deltaproteobacteria bacterium]|nr:ABC transporter ATP-binding protein [Deltaproteobacteria bacterium]
MSQNVVTVSNISKVYKIYESPRERLKEAFSRGGRSRHTDFWALHDVSFSVKSGVTMGILGVNGSGKSTLLKIICGFLEPTRGTVATKGVISAILELGTGFNRDFTGRNNVNLYCSLMGLSQGTIREKMEHIEDFAELGDFFDRPLRLYSSGMVMRLAFACTIYVNPRILIIDEALAVGDMAFQHKCMHRIRLLQESGVTLLFVSHSIATIKSLCDKAIMLDRGEKIYEGEAEEVANFYHDYLARLEQRNSEKKGIIKNKEGHPPAAVAGNGDMPPETVKRPGTGEIRIKKVAVADEEGRVLSEVDFDSEVRIRVHLTAFADCCPQVAGIQIRDKFGIELLGSNTAVENMTLPSLSAGQQCTVDFRMRLPLLKGTYSITAAVGHNPDRPLYFDWWDLACTFEMLPPRHRKIVNSKVYLPVEISVVSE